MAERVRIGSRPSQLALAQAGLIKHELERRCPGLTCELVAIRTTGDKLTTPSLAQVGGKGLFVRELEQALKARQIDLAVHSMKDLPSELDDSFRLAAIPVREVTADVLIGVTGGLAALPPRARLGTSSLRRRFEALRVRRDLEVVPLRGNVDTRLARLEQGDFDAVILAAAGLARLGRRLGVPSSALPEDDFVPSGGQGALAVEVLAEMPVAGARELERALLAMDDSRTRCETTAERTFLTAIGASCASPVGVRATAGDNSLMVRALLFSLDGAHSMTEAVALPGPSTLANALAAGADLAERMLARGAGDLLGSNGDGGRG
jgi:hydroxymethylbilane synthase